MALGVLSIFSIGVFVLPVAAGLAVVVATRKGSFVGLAGLVSGCGIPLLWVAYLNRSGPGNLCWYHPDGGSGCVQEWNPWPFAVIGLLLIGVGVLAFTKSARPRPKVRSTRT